MSDVDDAVLATLMAPQHHLDVYDGYAPVDEAEKVITVDLPYVVLHAAPPFDVSETYDSSPTAARTEWSLTAVGQTRQQVQAVLARAHQALGEFLTVSDTVRLGVNREPGPTLIRREETYRARGGTPIFYGVVRYEATT